MCTTHCVTLYVRTTFCRLYYSAKRLYSITTQKIHRFENIVITNNEIHFAHLVELELDTTVSGYLTQRQLIETREQQLHVRQEGIQGDSVVGAQGRVQTGIQTCFLAKVGITVTVGLRCTDRVDIMID